MINNKTYITENIKENYKKPLSLDDLTQDELISLLNEASESVKNGNYYTVDEVDEMLQRDFDI